MILLEILSAALSVALALFSITGLVLVLLRLVGPKDPLPAAAPAVWPRVLTQLPLYNEAFVAERLLRAVTALDYPRELHQVQVLDDSTDETSGIVDRIVQELRAKGHHITVVRRSGRVGFKAGALAHGLAQCDAEYVAIFDADFVPRPDYLTAMLPRLISAPKAAFVQARWGHLNADANLLTRAQVANIDAHFHVQQRARAAFDLWMNFNGSAGIWRCAAITDAGGWQGDTLTEDLDLSHRATMAGWAALYADEVVVPAEVPATISAYRQQQFRWALGSTQTLRKLSRPLWDSDLPVVRKAIGLTHLAQYLVQPLLVLHCLLYPWVPTHASLALLIAALLTAALPVVRLHRGAPQRIIGLGAMMLLGTGMAWTGTRAVWAACKGQAHAFERTPKGAAIAVARSTLDRWIELALATYAWAALICLGTSALPGELMHASGFTLVNILSWRERRPAP